MKLIPALGLKTSIQNFDAFVRCTLMGNQPWPQFQNGIRERSIKDVRANCYCSFRMILCAPFPLIPQSNAVFSFEARFYHSAFTQQSSQAAIIHDHSYYCVMKSDRSQQAQDVNAVLSNCHPGDYCCPLT